MCKLKAIQQESMLNQNLKRSNFLKMKHEVNEVLLPTESYSDLTVDPLGRNCQETYVLAQKKTMITIHCFKSENTAKVKQKFKINGFFTRP